MSDSHPWPQADSPKTAEAMATGLLGRLRALIGLDRRRPFATVGANSTDDWGEADAVDRGSADAPDRDWISDADGEPRLRDIQRAADIRADATEPDPVSPALARLLPALWGDGFSHPGGATFALDMTRPLALTPDVNLLDLNAGLGGAARLLADRFGVWVEGRDSSPRLVKKATDLAHAAGLSRKAKVQVDGPGAPPLRSGFYDAAFLRDVVFRTDDKDALLDRTAAAMVAHGELLIVDFVRPDDKTDGPAFAAWRQSEKPRPTPWHVGDWRRATVKRGWELRLCQDVTNRYKAAVLSGLAAYVATLRTGMLGPSERHALLQEAELWDRRLAAFDEGSLRAYRLFAIVA